MQKFALLSVAAFFTALLLSLTTRKEPKPLTPECYISCFTANSNDLIQADALKPGFANLHENPKTFVLENPLGEAINFACEDGINANAYFIKAKKKTNNWLIVIQEWWGLNDYIKKEADAFATDLENINVIAIDMYDGKVASTRDSAMKYMGSAKTPRLESIVKGAIDYAGKKAKIFTVGWCFGGGWSLQASLLAKEKAKGCIMYYGRPEKDSTKLQNLDCPVIGFFGTLDKGIPEATIKDFESKMKNMGKNITVNWYNAGHGFANPSNPSFNKEAREDAYTKATAFIKENW